MFTSAFHCVKCNFQLILSPILGENYSNFFWRTKVFLLLLDDSRTAPLTVKDATRQQSWLTSSILDIATCRLMKLQQQKKEIKINFHQAQFRLFLPLTGLFCFLGYFSPTRWEERSWGQIRASERRSNRVFRGKVGLVGWFFCCWLPTSRLATLSRILKEPRLRGGKRSDAVLDSISGDVRL